MSRNHLPTLCLAVALAAGPAVSQDAETPAQEPVETVTEETVVEQPVVEQAAEDVVDELTEEVAPPEVIVTEDGGEAVPTADLPEAALVEAQAEVVVEDATEAATEAVTEAATEAAPDAGSPDLAEIAASDPALDVRTGEDGEVDAMVMLSDVLFSYDDATLSADAVVVLQGLAPKLEGATALEITGHTDSRGDEAYNIALGQRRAEAVRTWLVENSALTADIVTARGVGEAEPAAANLTEDGSDNPQGRALNRRVELILPDDAS